jgi:hypothetical protein
MRARVGKRGELKALMVRLPESLHEYLTEAARQRNTSLNLEVVTRLKASIELDRLLKINNADEALAAMAKLKRWLVDFRVLREGGN